MTENPDCCPACDFIASLPDFDDPDRFDERREALEARRRGGGRGYGFIAVTAVADDDSSTSTYGLMRETLRDNQHLWDAVQDPSDGTFLILVDGGEHETVESLRIRLEQAVQLVMRAARVEGVEVVTAALGSDEGGAQCSSAVWTAFTVGCDEAERRLRCPPAKGVLVQRAASA